MEHKNGFLKLFNDNMLRKKLTILKLVCGSA